jgi:hypothetical protein
MYPISGSILLCGFLSLPSLGSAQTSGGPRLDSGREEVFQSLKDSQWVRLAGPGLGRRDGRVLAVTATEIVVSSVVQPIRLPGTRIDTVWTRGHSALQGGILGGLLLGGLGAVLGFTIGGPGDDDYDPGFWGPVLGGGGLVGGGLLGAAVGLAIPRWHRQYP